MRDLPPHRITIPPVRAQPHSPRQSSIYENILPTYRIRLDEVDACVHIDALMDVHLQALIALGIAGADQI